MLAFPLLLILRQRVSLTLRFVSHAHHEVTLIKSVLQRGTTTGLVLSGFGLSAFFFATIASLAFPGDTSALLLVLALGTAMPMLLGLVIVRQVPLPPVSSKLGVEGGLRGREGYQPIPSNEAAVFIGENGSHAPLLDPTSEHEQEVSNYHVPESSTAVELLQDRSSSKGSRTTRSVSRGKPVHDGPNIYGKQLWLTPDFYILFVIMSLREWSFLLFDILLPMSVWISEWNRDHV
jgi:hypothetical protein